VLPIKLFYLLLERISFISSQTTAAVMECRIGCTIYWL